MTIHAKDGPSLSSKTVNVCTGCVVFARSLCQRFIASLFVHCVFVLY